VRIEARDVGKRFGRVFALRGVSFAVEPGQRVALIGPNGSGKSTLTRVLMGLLSFTGDVPVDGRSPFRSRVEIAERMAYVPQIALRLAVPVPELLRAVGRVRGGVPARLGGIARGFELDPGEIGARPFSGLSGGMRQKLRLALALAPRAALLVLDEPTGSLDAAARERFYASYEDLVPDSTLLLCSHRLEKVRRLVDRVIPLDEGRVSYDGPAAGFLAASSVGRIEVCAEGGAASGWLEQHGFRPRSGGWWGRTVSQAEKMKILPELTRELDPAIRDLHVRELEGAQRDE
jgi:ABC-type multidrug transport system ATPase subunit